METTSKPKIPPKVWIIAGAAAALVAIVAGILLAGRPKATTMHLLRAEGTVSVSDGEDKVVKLRENLGLYGGYQVGTQSSSYAWIDLDEVKLTKMDQDSEIQIHKEDKHLEIEVKSGSLFFNVTQPLQEDETLNIRTSTMVVGIRGTCGWVVDKGEKGAQVYILEGTVEAEAVNTGETVTVSAGEMAQVTVTKDGETQIEVHAFAEEYVAPFVLTELENDTNLSAAVLEASGLDVLDSPDPAERLQAEYQEIISGRPMLDRYAEIGTSYIAENTAYASEGLSQAFVLDLNHDGAEELVLVTQQGNTTGGAITKLEVYGSSMGYAVLYDELNVAEGEYVNHDIPNTLYLRNNGTSICLWMEYSGQYLGSTRVYALEGQSLVLIDRSDDEGRGISGSYEDIPETRITAHFISKVPSSVQQKVELLKELNSHEYDEYPKYAKLTDTDQDGESEMYLLSYDFCMYDWDGTQIQSTVLENNVAYAKLIDMDQDGTEELLLLTNGSGEMSFKVYSWGTDVMQRKELDYHADYFEYNIYREKETGIIYVGGLDGGGSRGEHTTLCSLTDTLEFSWYDHSSEINSIWDSVGGNEPTEAQWAAMRAAEEAGAREAEEYSIQLARFELIERINTDSFEWQESLASTVDEVRQQLMAR